METNTAAPFSLEGTLIFFDLETTGIKVQEDRFVGLSAIKLHPDAGPSLPPDEPGQAYTGGGERDSPHL